LFYICDVTSQVEQILIILIETPVSVADNFQK